MDRMVCTQLLAVIAAAVSLSSLGLISNNIAEIDYLKAQLHSACNATVPPAPPAAVPLDAEIPASAASGGNKLYAGVDFCVEIPDIYVLPQEWALSHGSVLCPAVTTYGATLLQGPVLVTEGDLMLRVNNKFVNMTKFLVDYDALTSDVCQDTCLNGATKNPFTCECACTDYYTGTACETPTCVPFGAFSTELQACVCDAVPEGITYDSFCRPTQIAPPVTPVTFASCAAACAANGGECYLINNSSVCVCTSDAQFGENCEYQCATKTINNGMCAPRNNWGLDDCYELDTNEWSCVCGGGYTWTAADTVEISEMRCTTQECRELFDAYKHICCAPGINCYENTCGVVEADCCVQYTHSEIACIASGCAFCNISVNASGTVQFVTTCAATGFVDSTECTGVSPFDVEGVWQTWQYDCSDYSPQEVCDAATRDTYLSVYEDTCGSTNYSAACLLAAREVINSMPWPRLSTGLGFREQVLYHAALFAPAAYGVTGIAPVANAAATRALRFCVLDHATLTYSGSIGVFVTDLGINADDFQCLEKFYVIPALDNTNTFYVFFLSTRTAQRYCLARTPSTPLNRRARMLSYFATDALDVNTLVWRQLFDYETGAYKDYKQHCRTTQLGAFSFGVEPKWQRSIWGVSNYGLPGGFLTAVENTRINSNVLTTIAYVDVPYSPSVCPLACRSTGTCTNTDVACLQSNSYNLNISWSTCCFCLWKYTDTFVQCY